MPEINYPRAPDPPRPFDPLTALDLYGKVNALQQFQAHRAVGEETQRAIRDGKFDPTAALRGIAGRPDAALAAPEATSRVLSQQGQGITNTTAQYEQDAAQTKQLHDLWGAMADKPKLTGEDLNNWVVGTARRSGIPAAKILDFMGSVQAHPGGLAQSAKDSRALSIGSAGTIAPEQGPPDPVTGAPTVYRRGAMNQAPPGGIATGLPPGSEVSSGAMQQDLIRSGQFRQDIFPLQKALDLAQKLGPGGMAPGSKGRQDVESYIYGLMPSLVPASMQDKIKNYAELEKYLVNNASQRAQNLGPHTNDGLAAAVTGSPNVHINDLAGIDLIKAQIALRRMEHAQTLQAAKAGPANYTSERAKFSASQDPQAYAIDMMTPEQIQQMHKTLKGADRARFNSSLKAAIDSGAVTPPSQ